MLLAKSLKAESYEVYFFESAQNILTFKAQLKTKKVAN